MRKIDILINCLAALPLPLKRGEVRGEAFVIFKREKGYYITLEPITLFLGPDIETSRAALESISPEFWRAMVEEKTNQVRTREVKSC
jgi:hypothetical protein